MSKWIVLAFLVTAAVLLVTGIFDLIVRMWICRKEGHGIKAIRYLPHEANRVLQSGGILK